jgi:hypothetical protein
MKTWTRIVGVACTFALATACTVTVGKGNIDDSDDLDFTDKTEDPETTEDETTDTSSTRETEETSSTNVESSTRSEPSPSSTSIDTSTSSDTSGDTSTQEPSACAEEPEPDTCEECVDVSCQMEWQNCCSTEGCVETWTAIHSCVIENPSDDPWNDFDQCAAGASDTGDQIDLPVEVQDLYSCVNAPFMTDDGTDPRGWREQGDGTCTLLCYNIASLDQ